MRYETYSMGFANAFSRAGLFNATSSDISAVSTTSGASWFSTQFFFSEQFRSQTAGPGVSPQKLRAFVVQWMETYHDLIRNVETDRSCITFTLLGGSLGQEAKDICNLLHTYNGSWANFVKAMLDAASTNYQDPGFTTRLARSEDMVQTFKEKTQLFIQMTLSPNSRTKQSEMSYISPKGSAVKEVYAVPLAMQCAITKSSTDYHYSVQDSSLPLVTRTAPAPEDFSLQDYKDFNLYVPPPDSNVTTKLSTGETPPVPHGKLATPFSGSPTVTQIAAVSSDAPGFLSGSSPSVLAQFGSLVEYEIMNNKKLPKWKKRLAVKELKKVFDKNIYASPTFAGASVCSQWPDKECGADDGQLIDGGFSDNPSLALNVAHYQTVEKGDLSRLKRWRSIFYCRRDVGR